MAEDIKKQVEVQAKALPPASLATLKQLRQENCGQTSKDFHLQSFQVFVRRMLSPDSPTRNMLLVHGTGVGKTCTSIQVAEEYILRPEFQDKKVLVLATSAVEETFRSQIFDVNRVEEDHGFLRSQQCTGRRYLEMLERARSQDLRWENPENRERLNTIVQKMINDFYEFSGYIQFYNLVETKRIKLSPADFEAWVHENFDGRLLILDEAHKMGESESEEAKRTSDSVQRIVKIANGMTLVLLTATPMYDSFQEVILFFNLFLWNDKRQGPSEKLNPANFFKADGMFKSPEAEARFRGWCHEYVSFIRGENPFTFPFRLPPPPAMVAPLDRKTDFKGTKIKVPRKYLPLVSSVVEGVQKERVLAITGKKIQEDVAPTIVVSPDGRSLTTCFEQATNTAKFQYRYAKGVPAFLGPSQVGSHAAKFATVIKCIQESTGIVFVYSNLVRGGAMPFAMCLEEHGFEPATGKRLLENPSGEYSGASKGRYAFLTSETTDKQIAVLIRRLRKQENSTGQDIRVIVGSYIISEGVDFKNVRQVHILDPWYNMSRMEQIIGRGLRTCSHSVLPFEEQNCTVYLHTLRYADSTQETYDEYVYRNFVENKAKSIARVKRVLAESSVDCTTQISTNQLPESWRGLIVPQRRSQDREVVEMPLSALSAPTFEDGTVSLVCAVGPASAPPEEGEEYIRPLSSYLDIRDEVFDEVIKMFKEKPLWKRDDLLQKLTYAPAVVTYILESAVHTHLKLRDQSGRIGTLENRDGVYAFLPEGAQDATMFERAVADPGDVPVKVEIPEEEKPVEEEKPEAVAMAPPETRVADLRAGFEYPSLFTPFRPEVVEWFLVDQVMKPADKQTLILSRPMPTPAYAAGLELPGIGFVMGDEKVVDAEGKAVDLTGTERDAYKMWATTHLERVAGQIKEGKILCTCEDQTFKMAAFEVVEGHIQRVKRTKTVKPKACTSFDAKPELDTLVKDAGMVMHPDAGGKKTQCIFISMVVRSGSDKFVWVQPEVWSVISGPTYSSVLRSKIV